MISVLRLRVGVPGHGAKIARLLGVNQVSQTGRMMESNRSKDVSMFFGETDLFNYGVAHNTSFLDCCRRCEVKIYNDPLITSVAADKLKCLSKLTECYIPTISWTKNIEQAMAWTEVGRVYCRTLTRSKKGKGIVIASCPENVVPAPLYTLEYPKTREYRVHVFNGECIDWVQKKSSKRLAKSGEVNDDIRNRNNGWVFAHKNRKGHPRIRKIGVDAVNALGLDYGAVDILAQWEGNKLLGCVVCEVNTAPGMSSPTTLNAYLSKIGEL